MQSPRQFILPISAIATSILGAWLASSIMAALKMPLGLIILAGLCFLPILPAAWIIYQERRIRRIWSYRIPFLTRRISWRVLILNLGLITALLTASPQFAVTALRQHGDGMLGNLQGEKMETMRAALRQAANETADGLGWVHKAASETLSLYTADLEFGAIGEPITEVEQYQWPWRNAGVHSAVKNMPSRVETSITAVANYIAAQEPDPTQRIKALHDYVATRIEYDAPAFLSGNIPDQNPESVFRTHKAVCQGYADLLTTLGRAIGVEIVTLDGYARTPFSSASTGKNHAWNAVKLAGQWRLLDPTWDSGHLNDSGVWDQQYTTDYLMLPPEVMLHDHFPSDSEWQLLDQPLTFAEFEQLPNLKPRFFAEGLRLIAPIRHQTEIDGTAEIQLENPKRRYLLANYVAKNGSETGECNFGRPTAGNTISCRFHHSGRYEVQLYSSSVQYSHNYTSIGKLEFNFNS